MTTMGEVVARLRAAGDRVKNVERTWLADREMYEHPKPLNDADLAQVRMPGAGGDIPPDLATWLAYDASWMPLVDNSSAGSVRLAAKPLREILAEWAHDIHEGDLQDELEDEIEDLELTSADKIVDFWITLLPSSDLADTYAVRLPAGDQWALLMYESDRQELRVLACHKFIEFWWKFDSFSDYLADWLSGE